MTYTVKENADGTVTIDRDVYEELRGKVAQYESLISAVVEAYKKAIMENKGG